ncbi:MAG: sugar phosphate isomerase/epimerase [Armatimonadota bacterium]|nr:sugar phosphate isomerase/epimerase [Armatimonadota bacterium]
MKIGLRMPPMARELGFDGLVQWAAEVGLQALDTPPITAEMKGALDAAGLELGSVDAKAVRDTLSPDAEKRAKGVAEITEGFRQAAALGAKTIFACLTPPDVTRTRAQNFEIWKETWPAIVACAEELGLSIALEPWPGGAPTYSTLGCTPEMWRAMFSLVPSPALGICFDPSHLVRLGIDYLRALHEFGARVRHVHAKDCEILPEGMYEFGTLGQNFGRRYAYGEGCWRYTVPGEGQVNWGTFIRRLEDVGYDGILSIELEDHRYTGSVARQQEGVLAAMRHLRLHLRQ